MSFSKSCNQTFIVQKWLSSQKHLLLLQTVEVVIGTHIGWHTATCSCTSFCYLTLFSFLHKNYHSTKAKYLLQILISMLDVSPKHHFYNWASPNLKILNFLYKAIVAHIAYPRSSRAKLYNLAEDFSVSIMMTLCTIWKFSDSSAL